MSKFAVYYPFFFYGIVSRVVEVEPGEYGTVGISAEPLDTPTPPDTVILNVSPFRSNSGASSGEVRLKTQVRASGLLRRRSAV